MTLPIVERYDASIPPEGAVPAEYRELLCGLPPTRIILLKALVDLWDGNAGRMSAILGIPPSIVRRIAEYPPVARMIDKLHPEADIMGAMSTAGKMERKQLWTMIMRDEAMPTRDRLSASELLGKVEGDFIERKHLTGDITLASVVKQLASEDAAPRIVAEEAAEAIEAPAVPLLDHSLGTTDYHPHTDKSEAEQPAEEDFLR